jgi:DNA polymerase III subunit epsilon
MREIILDTETTGLDPTIGHRIIEIGCVELVNAIPTGDTFHFYIDPERKMPKAAFRVQGLSAEFLSDKPVFAKIAEDFLTFNQRSSRIMPNSTCGFSMRNSLFWIWSRLREIA